MKRFYNNTIMSGALSKVLRVFALLCVLFGVSATAWGAQFETNGTALALKLNTSNDMFNYGVSGHDVTNLNTVCNPIHIKEAYIYVDKTMGGDFCGGELRIIDGNGDRQVGGFGYQQTYGNSDKKQVWKWSGDFEVKPTTAGDHTFQIYVKGNFCSYDSYLSNDTKNYSFSYTIKSANITTNTKTYLAPGVWDVDGAGFAAYYWNECNNANAWARGTLGCGGNYSFSAPAGNWTHLKYVRLNSANADMNFDNDWDQTENLTYDSSKTLYTISGWGSNNVATGSWGKNNSTAPTLTTCQQIIFQLNKGNANQNDGWNGDNPSIYLWDCNGQSIVNGAKTNNGKYVLEPGNAIPYGVNFVSEHNFGDNKGKTGDIIVDFQPNKKYTFTLTGGYSGNGYDRVFAYNMTTESVEDICNQEYTYAIAGTFNNWSTTANTCDIKKGEKCTQSFELTKGTYQFKVLKEGVLYGKNNTTLGPTDSNGVTTTVNTSGGDIQLTASQDGFYSFIFWEESGEYKVKVTYDGVGEEPVLISGKPAYDAQMQNVYLYGYIQKTLCQEIGVEKGRVANYGFFICPGSASSPCVPNAQSQQLQVSGNAIQRGDEFSYQVNYKNDHIIPNAVYGYRAYVEINDKIYLSKEVGTFMLPGECDQPKINLEDPASSPIVYTIDASLGKDHADDCNLVYGSLQTALNRLQEIAADNTITDKELKYTTKNGSSIDLNAPIVFNIMYYDDTPDESSKAYCYEGNRQAGVSGGGASSESAYSLIIEDINRGKADGKSYTLTLQNGGEGARPWLHHVILRNSRNVVLNNLALFSDPTETNLDDALEFDINSKEWNNLGGVGSFKNAQIVVKNCMIGSNGFTGVHASAYDGITFINNEFEAIMAKSNNQDDLNNAITYGASAKFLACSNIQFVRNNFRGAHATLLWIQECQDALFMNNVFWNTNQYAANCSAVRMVDQFANKVTDVGFYYNTFYLEDDEKTSEHKYDFLHYSSINNNTTPTFSNIEFMYNNCYSYDTDLAGKEQDPTTKNVSGANYCPNNFWSVYDQGIYNTKTDAEKASYVSAFAFGCADNKFINVKEQVCSTTATGPSSLQIKGTTLNKGICPQTPLAVKLGVASTYRADRYNDVIRPETVTEVNIANNQGWTFGAYQSQSGVELKKIYWVGLSDDWDDRNNWVYYPSEQTAEGRNNGRVAETPQRVSCINALSADLQVVIPEHSLLGMDYEWPVVPTYFDKDRSNLQYDEEVSAGKGIRDITPTKYASTIEVEYGAAIKGVENLGEAVRYNKAISHFVAKRSQWILVGTVVKPFVNGNSGDVRNIKSGNYFLNYEPNVYMHEAIVNDMDQATWDKAFADLEKEVSPDQVFAINIPDEYGNGRISSRYYYNKILFPSRNGDVNDGTQAKPFSFTGRFANDAAMPSFKIVEGKARMMNNSYPSNVSAKKVEDIGKKGTVSYYDYEAGSFRPLGNDDVMLKPQHGFVFTPKATGIFTITKEMLADGNTRSRSAEQPKPSFAIGLYNAGNNTNMSEIIVRYDAEHTNGVEHIMDSKKVYSPIAETPELYMLMYDAEYARLHTAKAEQTIPLGIMLKQDMSVKFAVLNNRQFSQVILVDKLTGKEFDLLQHSYTTGILAAGKLEGRYYLNLVVEGEYDNEQEGADDFITTDIEDTDVEMASINIVTDATDKSIRVIGNNTLLQTIYVSDMSGRTMRYDVSGSAAHLQLPVAGGVYLVHVIGDNATRTEKVIVK